MKKQCSNCKESKKIDCFYDKKTSKNGKDG